MTTSREASRRSRIRDLVPLLVSAALVASAAAAARREARPEPPRPIDPAVEAPLRYDVRDAASGEPIPCKLVFVGEGATPTPAFTDGDIGREEGHAIAAHDRVLSAVGVGAVHVPLGAYEVHVGRGPEWEEAVIRHLVVGPEGGISPEELRAFADAGAVAYRMGPTVLRTSTAGTVAAAVLLARSGRWSSSGR